MLLSKQLTFLGLCAVMALGVVVTPAQAMPESAIAAALTQMQLPPSAAPWANGQESTYRVTADSASGGLTMDTRLAITGEEEGYYWLEVNLSNFGGALGAQATPFASSLTLRFLTKSTDPNTIKALVGKGLTNPTDAVDENLVKKLQLQLSGKSLWEIETTSAKEMAEQAFPHDMVVPEADETVEPEPAPEVTIDSGLEDITVVAGPFPQSTFWDLTMTDAKGTTQARANFHEDVPLLPLAKIVLNGSGEDFGGNLQVKLELVSKATSGAVTQTVGEPKPFDMNGFFNEIFGSATFE